MSEELFVNSIVMDLRCQPRKQVDPAVIDEYAESMKSGASFPPVTVFSDGQHRWLADGFHRVHAAKQMGALTIEADVRDGTIRDAILHAVGANADHGLRRKNDDKRRAVETLLNDPEWAKWSDREIARRCAVTHPLVASIRASLEIVTSDNRVRTVKYTDRWGKERQMGTGNIGSKPNLASVDMDSGEVLDDEPIELEGVSEFPAPSTAQTHSTRMLTFPVQPQLAPAVGDEHASLRLTVTSPQEAQAAVMAAFPMIGFIHPPDAMKIAQKLNAMTPLDNEVTVDRIRRNDVATIAQLVDRPRLQVNSPEDLAATQAGEAWRKTLANISQRLASVYREGGVAAYAPHWSKMERHELLHQTNGMIEQITRFRDDLKGFINATDAQ